MNEYQTEPLNLSRVAPSESVKSTRDLCTDCNSEYCIVKKLQEYKNERKAKSFLHRFECELCGKSYAKQSSLWNHLQKIHIEYRAFCCEFCSDLFTTESALSVHMQKHSDEKPFECRHCSRRFARQSSLSAHNRIHKSAELEFQCSICGKRFEWKSSLAAHLSLHETQKFFCNLCQRFFGSAKRLLVHQQKHHCRHCEKVFSTRYKLNYHIRLNHRNIAPWQCQFCTECFSTAAKFRSHIYEIHDSPKPFACDKCPQTFQTKHNLNVHSATHMKCKRFECDGCGRQFVFKRNLYSHLKWRCKAPPSDSAKKRPTHDARGRRQYFCNGCNRRCVSKKAANNCTHDRWLGGWHRIDGNISNANIETETDEVKVKISLVTENRTNQIIPLYELNIPAVDSTSTAIDRRNSKPTLDSANGDNEPVILVQAFTTPSNSMVTTTNDSIHRNGMANGSHHTRDPFKAFCESLVPEIIVIDDDDDDGVGSNAATQ